MCSGRSRERTDRSHDCARDAVVHRVRYGCAAGAIASPWRWLCVCGNLNDFRVPFLRPVVKRLEKTPGKAWAVLKPSVLAGRAITTEAPCLRHGRVCKIVEAHVHIAGTCCQDHSDFGSHRGLQGKGAAALLAWIGFRLLLQEQEIIQENVKSFPPVTCKFRRPPHPKSMSVRSWVLKATSVRSRVLKAMSVNSWVPSTLASNMHLHAKQHISHRLTVSRSRRRHSRRALELLVHPASLDCRTRRIRMCYGRRRSTFGGGAKFGRYLHARLVRPSHRQALDLCFGCFPRSTGGVQSFFKL